MLADVLDALRCPVCPAGDAEPLRTYGSALRCARGHAFDVARQGYVNLATGNPGTGDTSAMVAARQAWLDAGHYDPLLERLAAAVGERDPGMVLDAGAGTGHYLAAGLDAAGRSVGLALDLSTHAAKRAARCHPRVGAVVTNAWGLLPVQNGTADVLLNVFAPRNPDEFARVLTPQGRLLVATPAAHHLAELHGALGRLGTVSVDRDKQARLLGALRPRFAPAGTERVEFGIAVTAEEAALAVAMGPTARHVEPEDVRARLRRLPEPLAATAAVDLAWWIPAA